MPSKFLILIILVLYISCDDSNDPGPGPGPGPGPMPDVSIFDDVTLTNLPSTLSGLSMDAKPGDLDGDGDLDIIIANEFGRNIFLENNGNGFFTDVSGSRLPSSSRDSEDVAIADFDMDGDLDIVIVSEDDLVNEMYLNDGNGFFQDVSNRIPVGGRSNAVATADLNGDLYPDLVIGNNGRNAVLINDKNGAFLNETDSRYPDIFDVTQDVEFGDVDNDGDLDLLVGNEDNNRLILNDGNGIFSDSGRIPIRATAEETREADFGDIDGDGDLDIFFANVEAFVPNADRANRLLLNDGNGFFTDISNRIPTDTDRTWDADFADLDEDGDLDIITGNDNLGGIQDDVPYRVYRNDGLGNFTDQTLDIMPNTAIGTGFDMEAADFNSDGKIDLFLCSRGSMDRLLIAK